MRALTTLFAPGLGYLPVFGRIAVSHDYDNTRQVAEAVYGHNRLSLPYGLVLIGY